MKPLLLLLVSIGLALNIAACAATPTPSTPTSIPRAPTSVAPTAASTQPAPAATATIQPNLRTDTIEFLTMLSSDDTVAVQDDVEKLAGVKNAQSSGQAIQVTYDPEKVNLQQIIAAIENYGVRVKK